MKGFYFITDADLSRKGNITDVRDAVSAGVGIVQYRNKKAGSREMFEEAKSLREICKGRIFLVNDRIDIALAAGADGVHIGQDDLPYSEARKLLGKDKIIGLTVHTVMEAVEAGRAGADYIGVSPIFETKTKLDAGKPAGLKLIEEIKNKVSIPIAAIGGINLANAAGVIKSGADMICAIYATVAAENVKEEIEKFQRLF